MICRRCGDETHLSMIYRDGICKTCWIVDDLGRFDTIDDVDDDEEQEDE